ncbi:unnamed protein product [Effrenium voratum]|uniref:Uncharacterized protein n=1 Tax=Effrenium voratum TaxID=2562239 RepID=A0AA36JPN4_9DINO|nr:unnamed protein product [Effrenium voratum]CAJ1422338.1 unnamed protein product [Effrenium voratum]
MQVEIKKAHTNKEDGRTAGIKFELPTQESGCQPVKRRRLQRHDASQSLGDICKDEGREGDNFWLKVKMQVKEEVEAMDTERKVKTESSFSTTAGDDGKSMKRQPRVKVEQRQSDEKAAMVKAKPVLLEETVCQLPLPTGHGLTDFDNKMTVWARQCAEFRRKSTWMPSRPCCPASLFFSSPIVPGKKDPPCVRRLSQKELCCLRRFFERGHPIFAAPLPASDPMTKPSARAAATTTQEEAGLPASGAACMKMWPWMRDLPRSIWAGRGLAYDVQSGLRRLSSACGGAAAMHGVQIWESVGAGQPAAADPSPDTGAAPGQGASLLAPSQVKPARVLSKQQAKQSGIPGIIWVSSTFSWQLRWAEKVEGSNTRQSRVFGISRFMKDGLNEAEAEAAALEAAKAFRAQLVAQGRIKEKLRDESLTSDVPGVHYQPGSKKWQVRISRPNGKKLEGGYFAQKASAEARALELRELHGLQRTVRRCARRAELAAVQPKVPYLGVAWHLRSQSWQARTSGHTKKSCSFKPLDHSEAEVEKAFAQAVEWLKEQKVQATESAVAAAKGKVGKKGGSKG